MKNYCLNCESHLNQDDSFCPACGQSKKTYLLSIWSLIVDFFGNVFNLDNSVFKSLRLIFKPWKLSQNYIAGRRRQFTNPIRLFMIMMIIHFALFSFSYLRNLNDATIGKRTNIYSQVTLSEKMEMYDELVDFVAISADQKTLADTIRNRLFTSVRNTDQDTFSPLANLNISGTRFSEYGILRADVVNLSEKELLEKYKIGNFMDRLLVRQSIRIYHKPVETLRFFIGNLIWGVFLIVITIGLTLKLLYIRHSMLYVEHVVFMFTFHSTAFFLAILVMIIDNILGLGNGLSIYGIAFIPILIWLFIAMKINYQQGIFKTLFKFIAVVFSYFWSLIFVVLIIFFATILIF